MDQGATANHCDDLHLAQACARCEPRALATFEQQLVGRLDLAVGGMRLQADELEELKQRLRTRLLVGEPGRPPRISGYNGDAPLRSWVRTVAVRLATDIVRARPRHTVDPGCYLAGPTWSPELTHLRARYGTEIGHAVRRALAALAPADRLLLRQHYVDGLSCPQLGRLYKAHGVTILRRLQRARQRLGELARRDLEQRLALPADDLASVLQLLASQVDMTLSQLR